MMRTFGKYAAITGLALFCLCGITGCKTGKKTPTAPGEPILASPAEQASLFLSINPRDVMVIKMPSSGASTQLSGGWGFTREEACIIHNPKNLGKEMNRDFLNWVQALIDVRNVLEFSQTLPSGERLYAIDSANYVKETLQVGQRRYLRVMYSVFTLDEPQFRDVSHWAKNPKVTDEMFNNRVRTLAREQEREFWFDITEPHNHNESLRGL